MWKTPEKITISLKEKGSGTVLEGILQEKRIVEVNGKDSTIWKFLSEDDKIFEVWGFAALNNQLEAVPIGVRVRVTYQGKSKTRNQHGNYSHMCKVEVWNEDEEAEVVEEAEKTPF